VPDIEPENNNQPSREPLQIHRELRRAWNVLKLKPQEMLHVSRDAKDAVEVSIVFLITGAILSYIGSYLYPMEFGGKVRDLAVLSRITSVIAQVLMIIGIIWITSMAARQFRAPLTFNQLFRILGYASIIFVITFFPFLMLLAFAWWFTVSFIALRNLGQLDMDRALLITLIGVIILFVISRLLGYIGVYVWFGRWAVFSTF
jgi:magnesium-transporting ATPase (P-type)